MVDLRSTLRRALAVAGTLAAALSPVLVLGATRAPATNAPIDVPGFPARGGPYLVAATARPPVVTGGAPDVFLVFSEPLDEASVTAEDFQPIGFTFSGISASGNTVRLDSAVGASGGDQVRLAQPQAIAGEDGSLSADLTPCTLTGGPVITDVRLVAGYADTLVNNDEVRLTFDADVQFGIGDSEDNTFWQTPEFNCAGPADTMLACTVAGNTMTLRRDPAAPRPFRAIATGVTRIRMDAARVRWAAINLENPTAVASTVTPDGPYIRAVYYNTMNTVGSLSDDRIAVVMSDPIDEESMGGSIPAAFSTDVDGGNFSILPGTGTVLSTFPTNYSAVLDLGDFEATTVPDETTDTFAPIPGFLRNYQGLGAVTSPALILRGPGIIRASYDDRRTATRTDDLLYVYINDLVVPLDSLGLSDLAFTTFNSSGLALVTEYDEAITRATISGFTGANFPRPGARVRANANSGVFGLTSGFAAADEMAGPPAAPWIPIEDESRPYTLVMTESAALNFDSWSPALGVDSVFVAWSESSIDDSDRFYLYLTTENPANIDAAWMEAYLASALPLGNPRPSDLDNLVRVGILVDPTEASPHPGAYTRGTDGVDFAPGDQVYALVAASDASGNLSQRFDAGSAANHLFGPFLVGPNPNPGACCFPDGLCLLDEQPECAGIGGLWLGGGTTCDPNPCPPPAGSCCSADGSCTISEQSQCTGVWTIFGSCTPNPCPQPEGSCCHPDGSCTLTTQALCTGVWTLFGACSPNPCPAPNGSCCHPNGTCAVSPESLCSGVWTLLGTCTPNPCPPPNGRCCYPDGSCAVTLQSGCSGTWTLFGECSPNPCGQPAGSCCYENGSCAVTLAGDCTGVWTADGQCDPNPCPQPEGSCCLQDGTCAVTVQAGCAGTWTISGACDPNPCPQPTGACCAADGACTVVVQAQCAGTWTLFALCAPNPCPQPTGSCCATDGACSVTLQPLCTGAWTMFAVCSPNPCPQPTGSCCVPDGSCTVTVATDCTGSWTSHGECSPNPCPPPAGSCCDADGGCTFVEQAQCAGNWTMFASCAPNPCPQPQGSCCHPDGSCTVTLATDCTGSWLIHGNCDPNPCTQPTGSCCASNGSCAVTFSTGCSGTWLIFGNCDPNPCSQPTGSCCVPDGTCTLSIASTCSGTWTIFGVCTPNPCAQPTGSCCALDGSCAVTFQTECSGHWSLFGACDPNPCPPPEGSCCALDGACSVTDQAQCDAVWTMFASCTPNPCAQPAGRCCQLDGTCTVTLSADCAGAWSANGRCDPNPCPPPTGSCCAPDGGCGVTIARDCAYTWTPLATCTPNPCAPPEGSCCATDGGCTVTIEAACPQAWTMFATCTPNPCAQPAGDCCHVDGTCTVALLADCTGTWTAFGDCAPNLCPQPVGSCCASNGTCTETTAGECPGPWTMFGPCTPNPCNQPAGSCCSPDGRCEFVLQAACPGDSWQQGLACDPNPCTGVVTSVEVASEPGAPQWRLATPPSVTGVRGRYRIGGAFEFQPMEEFASTDGGWTASLPAFDYTIRGLEYFLRVRVGDQVWIPVGDSLQPKPLALSGEVPFPAIPPLTLRMVSAPLVVEGGEPLFDQMQARFGPSGSKSWMMGTWDPGAEGYRLVDAQHPEGLVPGIAYWIGFAHTQPAWSLTGRSSLPEEPSAGFFELPLAPRWNMAGNPAAYSVTADGSELQIRDGALTYSFEDAARAGLVGSGLYAYRPEQPDTALYYPYSLAPLRLDAWEGCWVWNNADRALVLRVPARSVVTAGRPPVARRGGDEHRWALSLTIRGGADHMGLAIGTAPDASEFLDPFDALMPPAAPGRELQASLLRTGPGGRVDALVRDTQPWGDGPRRWRVAVSGSGQAIQLSWHGLSASDATRESGATMRLTLVSDPQMPEWDMNALQSLELPPGRHELVIERRDGGARAAELSPGGLTAEPNPFGPAVTLGYVAASTADVILEVYNLAGSLVWRRFESHAAPGTHAVYWNGRGTDGDVPAGVYFVRVRETGPDGADHVSGIKLTRIR